MMTKSEIETWGLSRETDPLIVAVIYSIANGNRTMQQIWEAPTKSELSKIKFFLHSCTDGKTDYQWGEEIISIDEEL